jgi:hypothetical protein
MTQKVKNFPKCLSGEIVKTDAEIDPLFYGLSGLTVEEIRIPEEG